MGLQNKKHAVGTGRDLCLRGESDFATRRYIFPILLLNPRLTVSALVSDDILMGILVLKGGNALDLAYDLSSRGSIDIDFSMENDFTEAEKKRIQNQASSLLASEFEKENLYVFDVNFLEKPTVIDDSVKDFWGGYCLEFKLIEKEKFNQLKEISNRSDGMPFLYPKTIQQNLRSTLASMNT